MLKEVIKYCENKVYHSLYTYTISYIHILISHFLFHSMCLFAFVDIVMRFLRFYFRFFFAFMLALWHKFHLIFIWIQIFALILLLLSYRFTKAFSLFLYLHFCFHYDFKAKWRHCLLKISWILLLSTPSTIKSWL